MFEIYKNATYGCTSYAFSIYFNEPFSDDYNDITCKCSTRKFLQKDMLRVENVEIMKNTYIVRHIRHNEHLSNGTKSKFTISLTENDTHNIIIMYATNVNVCVKIPCL